MQSLVLLALLASAQALSSIDHTSAAKAAVQQGAESATKEYAQTKKDYHGRAKAEVQEGLKHREEGLHNVQEGVLSLEQSEDVVKQHQAEIQKKMTELNDAYQGWEKLKTKVQSGLQVGKTELEKIKEDDKELQKLNVVPAKSATSMVEQAQKKVDQGSQEASLGKFQTVDAASQNSSSFGKASLLEADASAKAKLMAAAQGMAVSIRADLTKSIENGLPWKNNEKALALVNMLQKLPEARRTVAQELLKIMPHARNTSSVLLQQNKVKAKQQSQLHNKVFMDKFMKTIQRKKEVKRYIKRKRGGITHSDEERINLGGEDNNLGGAFFDSDDPSVVFKKLFALKTNTEIGMEHNVIYKDSDEAPDEFEPQVPVAMIEAPCMLYQFVRREHVMQKNCDQQYIMTLTGNPLGCSGSGPNIAAQCNKMENEVMDNKFFTFAHKNCKFPVLGNGDMFKHTDIDFSADPGDDFNKHANGNWMKANPIPFGFPYYDDHMSLMRMNEEKINALLEDLEDSKVLSDHDVNNVETLYNDAQNYAVMNALGNKPIQPMLEVITNMTDLNMMESLAALGFDWGVSAFLDMGTEPDAKDSTVSYMIVSPADREVFPVEIYDQKCPYTGNLTKDEQDACDQMKQMKTDYLDGIAEMLELAGPLYYKKQDITFKRTDFKEMANRIWDLEHDLAHAIADFDVDAEEDEDEDDINFIPASAFNMKYSGKFFKFDQLFDELGKPLEDLGKLGPIGGSVIKEYDRILSQHGTESVKAYMYWQVIRTYAPWLDAGMRTAHFNLFNVKLMGQETEPSAKEKAQSLTKGLLGMEVGTLYAEAYFTPATRQFGMDMIKNLIKSFKANVDAAKWIKSDKTREGANAKADNFLIKLGWPEEPPDHSSLFMVKNRLVESIVNANRFYMRRMLDEANAATDFTEWGMTPDTVNAYYNPRFNEFVIPAGIFQRPFFDIRESNALNYGSIGAVVGHEMTHSVDPYGRKYNWKGNRENWATKEDDQAFGEITKALINHANNYRSELTFGVQLDGHKEQGEMVADNGGVQLAWDALKHSKGSMDECHDGFDEMHRFWYSYAANWRSNTVGEFVARQVKDDVHPPADFRVNGVVTMFKDWRDLFHVKQTEPLYKTDAQMFNVWPQESVTFGEGKLDRVKAMAPTTEIKTKRGVKQPHPNMDGMPDPGHPTHHNGRKRHHHHKKKDDAQQREEDAKREAAANEAYQRHQQQQADKAAREAARKEAQESEDSESEKAAEPQGPGPEVPVTKDEAAQAEDQVAFDPAAAAKEDAATETQTEAPQVAPGPIPVTAATQPPATAEEPATLPPFIPPLSPDESLESRIEDLLEGEWKTKVGFTVAFIILEIIMSTFYFMKKTNAETPPNDGSEHSVALLEKGEFRYGLFDCLQTPALTCFTVCCCPVRWADTLRMAGFMAFWLAAAVMITLEAASPITDGITLIIALSTAVYYRQKLRSEFEIASGTAWTYLEDMLTYAFCPCLAVVQEARQIEEAYAVGHPIMLKVTEDEKKVSA